MFLSHPPKCTPISVVSPGSLSLHLHPDLILFPYLPISSSPLISILFLLPREIHESPLEPSLLLSLSSFVDCSMIILYFTTMYPLTSQYILYMSFWVCKPSFYIDSFHWVLECHCHHSHKNHISTFIMCHSCGRLPNPKFYHSFNTSGS